VRDDDKSQQEEPSTLIATVAHGRASPWKPEEMP
jgi:hypothetical protein